MAKMFHECPDENGIGFSHNAHPEQEYEHPSSQIRPLPPRWGLRGDGEWGELPAPTTLIARTRQRVLESSGRGLGQMTFEGDLKPRNEPEKRDEAQLK